MIATFALVASLAVARPPDPDDRGRRDPRDRSERPDRSDRAERSERDQSERSRRSERDERSQRPRARISLDSAVSMAERRFNARVVRADTRDSGDRIIYVLRLLNDAGRVWTVRVDASTGAMQ
jgi:uncharacterized membrane protein YkoI